MPADEFKAAELLVKADELRAKMDGYRRMAQNIAELYGRKIFPDGDWEWAEWERASGLCECQLCGMQYYDHPQDAATGLFFLCNGTVKHL